MPNSLSDFKIQTQKIGWAACTRNFSLLTSSYLDSALESQNPGFSEVDEVQSR